LAPYRDVRSADDDGNFYIVDRLKEFIKFKGFPVAPAELEALLLTHPSVRRTLPVIPIPTRKRREIPKAVHRREGDVTAGALMDFVAASVAPFKRVRAIDVVDEIPKSPSGKILSP